MEAELRNLSAMGFWSVLQHPYLAFLDKTLQVFCICPVFLEIVLLGLAEDAKAQRARH